MKKVLALVLVVVMIFALAACGQKKEDTIKIGYVGDLSGATALWGNAGKFGAMEAIEEINAAGGVLGKKLELVAMDGKGEAADSVSALRKLITDEHIVAEIGTNFSSCNIPMAAVADELKVPIIGTAASNELVTVDENGNLHPYSFRMCFLDNYIGTVIGTYATKDLGFKKGALLTVQGDTNSESVGQFIKEAFEKNGGTIVSEQQTPGTDLEFRAQLGNFKTADPEVIFVVMNDYAKNAAFAKQAREMDINCMLMGHDGWDSNELPAAAEGKLDGCQNVTRIGFAMPEALEFGEKIVAKYGGTLETECLFGRDGVYWIKDAIERAGSADPTAIRDALEATDVFEGLIGTLVMNPETHNPVMACEVFEFQTNEAGEHIKVPIKTVEAVTD
ncbi:MAG: ABC transporter substrate-binding protein [Oscillospiraceae bacterium]|nr:ABC transporter substrate-binding protein [Oscillospiraceae bacterium]